MEENNVLAEQHRKEKEESRKFKERRFAQWNENYMLYRDKVITNRLTQRQPINLPIMRETIQTWISKIDEPPLLTFEARGKNTKDKQGEIILNELWGYYYDKLKLDVLDNLDKKIVGLQGRSFKIWGYANNEIFCDLIDPYDIDIDPRVNPLDLNSAHYVIHKSIFKPLRTLLANKNYTQSAKNDLKTYLDSKNGLLKSAESKEEFDRRNERLQALGVSNFDDFRASDVMVEINNSYKLIWNEKENRFVRHLIVIAADNSILSNKPLKEAIGIDYLPIPSWADDPDLNDIWCDGKGDSVRTVNKVANMYMSQDLENRTFRNFGMFFFNTMNGQFKPQAFDPKPFGMYGVPGNPADVLQQMRIEPLGDTSNQIQFLKDLIQSSVAQTPTERGEQTRTQSTLGEIQINLQQSQGRNEVTAKNYRRAWKESGMIFYDLLNANSSGKLKLYKKGGDGEYYPKDIFPSDWQSKEGYECKVLMKSEKEADDQFALQKAQFIQSSFQNNPVALKITRQKQLELLGWTPEEVQQVMDYEDQATQQMQQQPMQPGADSSQQEGIVSPLQAADLSTS